MDATAQQHAPKLSPRTEEHVIALRMIAASMARIAGLTRSVSGARARLLSIRHTASHAADALHVVIRSLEEER
jgi:hypothetical protein